MNIRKEPKELSSEESEDEICDIDEIMERAELTYNEKNNQTKEVNLNKNQTPTYNKVVLQKKISSKEIENITKTKDNTKLNVSSTNIKTNKKDENYKSIGNSTQRDIRKIQLNDDDSESNENESSKDLNTEANSNLVYKFYDDIDDNVVNKITKFFNDLRNLDLYEFYDEDRIKLRKENEKNLDKLLNKITELKEENKSLRESLEQTRFEKSDTQEKEFDENKFNDEIFAKNEEIEELKEKLEKKNREVIDYRTKNENFEFELEHNKNKIEELKLKLKNLQSQNTDTNENDKDSLINNFKQEIKKKEVNNNLIMDENFSLKNLIETFRNDNNNLKNDLSKKHEKINELQDKLFRLEQENIDVISKFNNEIYKLKDQLKSMDNIKSQFQDLKYQNEKLIMNRNDLEEELFSLKKQLNSYERQRNTHFESMNKDKVINNNSHQNDSFSNQKHENYSHITGNTISKLKEQNQEEKNSDKKSSRKGNINNFLNKPQSAMLNFEELKDKKASNILPSQAVIIRNESKVIELENVLLSLQKERDQVQSQFEKLPEFPRQKAQIIEKKSLENKISQYKTKINNIKQELRDLGALNRDY